VSFHGSFAGADFFVTGSTSVGPSSSPVTTSPTRFTSDSVPPAFSAPMPAVSSRMRPRSFVVKKLKLPCVPRRFGHAHAGEEDAVLELLGGNVIGTRWMLLETQRSPRIFQNGWLRRSIR